MRAVQCIAHHPFTKRKSGCQSPLAASAGRRRDGRRCRRRNENLCAFDDSRGGNGYPLGPQVAAAVALIPAAGYLHTDSSSFVWIFTAPTCSQIQLLHLKCGSRFCVSNKCTSAKAERGTGRALVWIICFLIVWSIFLMIYKNNLYRLLILVSGLGLLP